MLRAKTLEPAVALRRRWLYLIVGAICFLFLGFVYGWSILAVPLQSEFDWTSAQISMTFTISTAMFCIGGVLGAQLSKRTAPQVTIILSAVFVCVGYIIASNVQADQIMVLHLAYGAVVGCSSGMAHNAIMGTVNRWFPDKVGTSSGFLTLGFGISSLAIGWLVGLSLDALGWRVTFEVIGVTTALVMLVVSFYIRVPADNQILPAADT
ncbi:MAG: OFA family MFS transporter, partial [Coriobacteriaceae bacterium]|nr:OFA family MFS transporter [Coriobacteriaceae bacterium]